MSDEDPSRPSPRRSARLQGLSPEIDVPLNPYEHPRLSEEREAARSRLSGTEGTTATGPQTESGVPVQISQFQQELERIAEGTSLPATGQFATATEGNLQQQLEQLLPIISTLSDPGNQLVGADESLLARSVSAPSTLSRSSVLERQLADIQDNMPATREQFDQALARINQAGIFLKTASTAAINSAQDYESFGSERTKTLAQVAIKQLEAKFINYCQHVQKAEDLLLELGLTQDASKALHDQIQNAYRAHSDEYVKSKCEADETYKRAEKQHNPATVGNVSDKLFKLPTLSIPTFGGDIKEFPKFEKNFMDIIGKTQLKDFQKLIHLKQALKGEASDAVASCGDDDSAYQVAWGILKGRYGDQAMLRPLLLNELTEIAPMRDGMTVKDQRKTHDKIRARFLKLSAIDDAVNESTSPIVHLVQAKYSRPIRREVERDRGTNLTPTQFLDAVEEIIRRESRYAATEQKKQTSDKKIPTAAFTAANTQDARNETPVVSLAQAFKKGKAQKKAGGGGEKKGGASGGRPANTKTKNKAGIEPPMPLSEYTCPVCKAKAAHYVSRCDKVLEQPPEERRKTVRSHGLCERCLRPGHTLGAAQCPFKNRACGKKAGKGKCTSVKHHPALHY